MKKVIFSFAILSLVFVTSCNKDDDDEKSCATLTTELTAATEAFFNENSTEEDCIEFKSAANAYLDNGCGTDDDRATLQALVDASNCEE